MLLSRPGSVSFALLFLVSGVARVEADSEGEVNWKQRKKSVKGGGQNNLSLPSDVAAKNWRWSRLCKSRRAI